RPISSSHSFPTRRSSDLFTQNWAEEIRKWFWEPVKKIGLSAEEYLPKLVTIIIILFIARYILRLFRFFALEVERGNLVIKNFHKDWAPPTYSLIRFVFLILVVIIIFPDRKSVV